MISELSASAINIKFINDINKLDHLEILIFCQFS